MTTATAEAEAGKGAKSARTPTPSSSNNIITYRSLGPDAGNGGLIKVVQYRDGEPGNGFWLQDDEILKSDWGGAVSTRAEGPAAARTGLPPGVEEAFERIRSSP